MNIHKIGWIILLIVITVAISSALGFRSARSYDNPSTRSGNVFVKVEGYRHIEPGSVSCAALIPECGYCMGEIINKECYIIKVR